MGQSMAVGDIHLLPERYGYRRRAFDGGLEAWWFDGDVARRRETPLRGRGEEALSS